MTPVLSAADWTAIGLTLKLAAISTVLLLLLGAPLAWWLARRASPWSAAVGALLTLPLVLPPTVLGFYLLLLMGPHGPIGWVTQGMGWGLLPFTFSGLVVASVLYSMPFVVQPLQQAFRAMGAAPMEAAATLGATPLDAFFSVALPMARQGIATAAVFAFAHTVGEFGVVLMLGGNIPGQTQVVSMAVYGHVEALEYANAHWLAGGLLIFSFSVLCLLYRRNARVRS